MPRIRAIACISWLFLSHANYAQAEATERKAAPSLVVHARVQPRLTMTRSAADHEAEFVLRRARIKLLGENQAWHTKLYVQLGLSPFDLDVGLEGQAPNPLRDARLQFFTKGWAELWVGLMKVPFSRERVISDGDLDMIDRSIVNAEFNLDRDYGLSLRPRVAWFSATLGVFSGRGRGLTETSEMPLSMVARIQLEPWGAVGESEGDLERSPRPRAVLGVATALLLHAPGDRATLGHRPQDLGTTDVQTATIDVAIKWAGWAFESAAIVRKGVRTPGPGAPPASAPRNGWGWFAQLSRMLGAIPLEIVGRVACVHPWGASQSTSLKPSLEAGGGLNLYLEAHDFKIGFDAAFRPTPDQAPTSTLRLQVQFAR